MPTCLECGWYSEIEYIDGDEVDIAVNGVVETQIWPAGRKKVGDAGIYDTGGSWEVIAVREKYTEIRRKTCGC